MNKRVISLWLSAACLLLAMMGGAAGTARAALCMRLPEETDKSVDPRSRL